MSDEPTRRTGGSGPAGDGSREDAPGGGGASRSDAQAPPPAGGAFAGEVITSLVETGDQIATTSKVPVQRGDGSPRPAAGAGAEADAPTRANPALARQNPAEGRARTESMTSAEAAGDPPANRFARRDPGGVPKASYARTDRLQGRQLDERWDGHPEVPALRPGDGRRKTLEQDGGRAFDVPPPAGMSAPVARPGPAPRRWPWWRPPADGRLAMDPVSRLTHHVAYEVIQAVLAAAVLAVLAFAVLGGQFGDLYIKLRGAAPASGHVALLTIGGEALYLLDPDDPSPATTPRTLLAELVRFLDEAGAAVIVLDILLDHPEVGDDELARAARAHGAVVGAERFTITDPSTGREFVAGTTPALVDAVEGGIANFQQEQMRLLSRGDMLVRRVPLVRRVARASLAGGWPGNMDGSEQVDGEVRPSLALLAAWLYRARQSDPGARGDDLLLQLQQRCGGVPLRCDDDGSALGLPPLPHALHEPLEINFRGPESADGLDTVRAAQVLRLMGEAALLRGLGVDAPMVPDSLRAVLDGRIVVVCRVDPAARTAGDVFVTPYAFPLMMGADMSGGRIQAQVIDTLLSGRHVRRAGTWLPALLALALVAAIAVSARVLRDDVHTTAWLVAMVAMVLAGAGLFAVTDGLVVGMGLPVASVLATLTVMRVRGWARE